MVVPFVIVVNPQHQVDEVLFCQMIGSCYVEIQRGEPHRLQEHRVVHRIVERKVRHCLARILHIVFVRHVDAGDELLVAPLLQRVRLLVDGRTASRRERGQTRRGRFCGNVQVN